MKKLFIIAVLFSVLLNCEKKAERGDIANSLRGNTFDMIAIGEKDTLTVTFKDSTYNVFQYRDYDRPWRIASFEDIDLLVFDSRVIALKQTDSNSLRGILISEQDYEIILERRETKWDKHLLIGTWVEKEFDSYFSNDSIPKPPVIPPPENFTKEDYQHQTLFEINADSIHVSFGYFRNKSKIDINNTNEFIKLDIETKFGTTDKLWKIKRLTNESMTVERTIYIQDYETLSITMHQDTLELIKKR